MRLEDVAKKAGVSAATASRVVNGLKSVSPSTRKRVMAAMEQLNYTPNLQARSLVSGQSKTIGMIVSNMENPFFIDFFHLLEAHALANGFEVLLANTNYDPDRLARTLRLMLGRRVSALAIAVSEELPKEVAEVVAAKIPVVCFDTGKVPEDVARIRLNAGKGVQKLIEHLHDLGHRRMAYIGHQTSLKTTEERRAAFFDNAERLGLEHIAVLGGNGFEAGRDGVRMLANRGFNASAILCVNDLTAFGVLRELRNRNLSVPDDISVSGFDNIWLSEFACPSLTTVHIPRDNVARVMFKMLTAKPEDASLPMDYLVDTEVVIRESTGPYRGGGLLARGPSVSPAER